MALDAPWLDDGANHEAAIVCATALTAPHNLYVDTMGHALPGGTKVCAGRAGLDDGANHEAAIVCATVLDAPHKSYVDTRVKQRGACHTLLQAELGLKMVPLEAAIVCATALDAPLILIRRSCIAWRNRFAAGRA